MKKWIGMILSVVITMGLLSACGSGDIEDQIVNVIQAEDAHVLSVKGGTSTAYPGKTYGEAFENFFGTPTWKYFVGTKEGPDEDGDGEPDYVEENIDIVEFTGYCMYQDVKVKALIQFTMSKDDDTFSATYLSFNDVPQNMLMLAMLLSEVFENEEMISESATIDNVDIDTSQNDMEILDEEIYDDYDYAALEFAGLYEGWGGYSISFSAYTSVEGIEIGVAEIYYDGDFVDEQYVYICDDRGDWSDSDYYDLFYVMHMDGYDEYLGFYKEGDIYMLDYNGPTSNYDILEMVEHYES